MTISKAAVWAATGFLGAGVAGGLTYAAVSTPAVASSDVGAAVDNAMSAAQPAATGPAGRAGLGRRGMLARLEHGQLTLRVKNGERTVDLQRGIVTAVSPTGISVASPDKFHGDYTVDAATKVRTANGLVGISAVHQGDKVLVVAIGGKVLRIVDRG